MNLVAYMFSYLPRQEGPFVGYYNISKIILQRFIFLLSLLRMKNNLTNNESFLDNPLVYGIITNWILDIYV